MAIRTHQGQVLKSSRLLAFVFRNWNRVVALNIPLPDVSIDGSKVKGTDLAYQQPGVRRLLSRKQPGERELRLLGRRRHRYQLA